MNGGKFFYSRKEYQKAKNYLNHIHKNKNISKNYKKYMDELRPQKDLENEKIRTTVLSAAPIIATNSIVRATTNKGMNIKPPAIGRSTSVVSDLLETASTFDTRRKNLKAREVAKAKSIIKEYHKELKKEKMKG